MKLERDFKTFSRSSLLKLAKFDESKVKCCVWIWHSICLDWHFICECAVLFLLRQTHVEETKITKHFLSDNTTYQSTLFVIITNKVIITARDLHFG